MPNHLDVVEDRQFLTAINTRRMYATGRNWPWSDLFFRTNWVF